MGGKQYDATELGWKNKNVQIVREAIMPTGSGDYNWQLLFENSILKYAEHHQSYANHNTHPYSTSKCNRSLLAEKKITLLHHATL